MFIFACFNSSWFIRLSAYSVKQVLDFNEKLLKKENTSESRKKQRRRLFIYFDKKGQARCQADARKHGCITTSIHPRRKPWLQHHEVVRSFNCRYCG